MADQRPDSSPKHRPDPGSGERRRSAPLTSHPANPLPLTVEDIFGPPSSASDEVPTIVSKHGPRAPQAKNDGIRGRRLAHFELIEQIGAGGMAAVLRARDTQLDRIVALKILPPDMALDAENVLRFHQEARSAAKLDHENIARVFFCGEDQRLHFIAFEYVDGENLRTILEHRGRLPVSEALPYVLQVAAGLAHAAERHVVHRDIKPSNIIITSSGRAKLVDMGLARTLGPTKDPGLTQSGVTLGTFDYISPEQALEPRDADVRSDIYSLGCTFYHMVTGRPPVPEGTAAKKLHHHQLVPPTDPREIVPDLPDEIALILDRMMAKDPRARYQTAGELVQHLLSAAKMLHIGADVPEGVMFVDSPLPRTPSSRPYLLVGIAVAAVVALIVFLDLPAPNQKAGKPTSKAMAATGNDNGGKNTGPKEPPRRGDEKPETMPPLDPPAAVITYEPGMPPEELLQKLAENKNPRVELVLAGDLNLKVVPNGIGELILKGDSVTVRKAAEYPGQPTIRLEYVGAADPERAGLRIRARESHVSDVRFEIEAGQCDVSLVGLALEGENHEVRDCAFVQKMTPLPQSKKRIASILVTQSAGSKTPARLTLHEDQFLGFKGSGSLKRSEICGQDAVVRRGAVDIVAMNCAFGPHETTIRLEPGDGKDGKQAVELDHCSIMAADQSAVVQVTSGAGAEIKVKNSLFSQPGGLGVTPGTEPSGAVFLQLDWTHSRPTVRYRGDGNFFHNLTAFARLPGKAGLIENWKDFARKESSVECKDEHSVCHKNLSPWENEGAIEKSGEDVLRIFAPKTNIPELRQFDRRGDLIGVERLAGKNLTEGLPVLPDGPVRLTVNPNARPDSANGVYPTLEAAIDAVSMRTADNTIWLNHDGDVVVGKMIRLPRNVDLTIRGEPGKRPVLTLGQPAEDSDGAALFRFYRGRLQLEDMEIRIRPEKNYTSQAVVACLSAGRCGFKNCLITLDPGMQSSTQLALATLPDTKDVMRMDATASRADDARPQIACNTCCIRGTGDLVWNQTGRPFDLDTDNVLVALTRSVCNVEVISEQFAAAAPSLLKMEHTTIYVGGSLLRVQSREVKDIGKLPTYRVEAHESVFLPDPHAPLVLFETIETDGDIVGEKLAKKVTWEPGQTNAFGRMEAFVSHQQINTGGPGTPIVLAPQGKMFTGTEQGAYNYSIPEPKPSFLTVKPSQMKFLDNPDLGARAARLEELLPSDSR